MAEAKVRDAWSRTSSVMALVANLHRPKGKRPFKPADFDPLARANARAGRRELPKVGVDVLKQVFLKPQPPEVKQCPEPESSSSPS